MKIDYRDASASKELFHRNCEILLERFPKAGFLSSTLKCDFDFFLTEKKFLNAKRTVGNRIEYIYPSLCSEELFKWKHSIDLENIDVLCIYKIGLGYHYFALKTWLQEDKTRELIFIEDDCDSFAAFLHTSNCLEILQDLQVHIYFPLDDGLYEEIAKDFPVSRVEVVTLSTATWPKKRGDKLRLNILKKTTLMEAAYADSLLSHKQITSFLANIQHLPFSFFVNSLEGKFQNIPAIVCGAGPSLDGSLDTLGEVENRGIVIAGGSGITALSQNGILPHIGVAIDPNYEEYLRLKESCAFEIPVFYATRLFSKVFNTLNGPGGYMRSLIGGGKEIWLEEKLKIGGNLVGAGLSLEAMSVTTIAIALARYLGCTPIVLCGIDLAYTDEKLYASGVITDERLDVEQLKKEMRASDRIIEEKGKRGDRVFTTVKWLMERQVISQYTKKFSNSKFIDATSKGLPFSNIPYSPLREVVAKYFNRSVDLRAYLHLEMQQSLFSNFTLLDIDKHIKGLHLSAGRCFNHVESILGELERGKINTWPTGKIALFEVELQEEEAYKYLFYDLNIVLENLLSKLYRERELSVERKVFQQKEKWEKFKEIVGKYLDAFDHFYIG